MKPLILPIKTPLGYYFYETQRNEIISVDRQIYHYIVALLEQNEIEIEKTDKSTIEQYKSLVDLGYCARPSIDKLQHPATGNLAIGLERKVERLLLQLTQNCNLRCQYCVYSEDKNFNTRSHASNIMSFEIAKKAIDFYFLHSLDENEKTIGFYGGEPLLNFGLIRKIVQYANELFKGYDIVYSITTNGTLFNDEIIDFFIENNVNVTISLDGPKSIHDKNRKFINGKGTYDILMNNIEKLKRKSSKEIPFNISMVIDPENNYEEIVELFENPIMKGINVSSTIVEEDERFKELSDSYYEKFEYDIFLGLLSYFREKEFTPLNSIIAQEIEQIKTSIRTIDTNVLPNITAPAGPCIPGKMRLFVDCFGNMFPCERVSETAPDMKIGNIFDGFDSIQATKLLNISQITEELCKKCWAFQLCVVCAKYAIEDGKISAAKKLESCERSRDSAYIKLIQKILYYENGQHEKKMRNIKNIK